MFELLKIFLEFNVLSILQFDKGKEFTAHVIEELVQILPGGKIIHRDFKNPQMQGIVEHSNQECSVAAWTTISLLIGL